jgi:intracellular septation protein
MKLLIDLGPLIAFFAAYKLYDIMVATAAAIVATLVVLIVSWVRERRVAVMPIVTGVLMVVFGGLTLWLADETFIKMKPTMVNGLFAAVLLGGAAFGQGLIKHLFGMVFDLEEAAWRALSVRWGVFFAVLALLNEIVWRTVSTDLWVNFKVFGLIGLTVAFSLAQMPFLTRHSRVRAEDGGSS